MTPNPVLSFDDALAEIEQSDQAERQHRAAALVAERQAEHERATAQAHAEAERKLAEYALVAELARRRIAVGDVRSDVEACLQALSGALDRADALGGVFTDADWLDVLDRMSRLLYRQSTSRILAPPGGAETGRQPLYVNQETPS